MAGSRGVCACRRVTVEQSRWRGRNRLEGELRRAVGGRERRADRVVVKSEEGGK